MYLYFHFKMISSLLHSYSHRVSLKDLSLVPFLYELTYASPFAKWILHFLCDADDLSQYLATQVTLIYDLNS